MSQSLRILLLAGAVAALAAPPAWAQSFVATGSYQGDGGDGRAVTGVGFAPDVVLVKSEGGVSTFLRTSTMPAGLAKNLGEARAAETGQIVSLDADGFTVGAGDGANAAGATYHWVALQAQPDRLQAGTYVGTGTAPRAIDAVTGTPVAVLVWSEGSGLAVLRTADMATYASYPLRGENPLVDGILAFQGGGFTVGAGATVNEAGTGYHWLAFLPAGGAVVQGSYLGDGGDDRDLAGLGLTPDWLLVRGAQNQDGVHRGASLAGDATSYFQNKAPDADAIQALQADGFQVGRRNEVNAAGVTYHWLALSDRAAVHDLGVALAARPPDADVGDTVTVEIAVTDEGGGGADGLVLDTALPAGLSFVSATASSGAYDAVGRRWTVGAVAPGATLDLALRATVDAGRGGASLPVAATLAEVLPADAEPANDSAAAGVRVRSVDVGLALHAATSLVEEGGSASFTLVATNTGPDAAAGGRVQVQLAPGLPLESAQALAGSYDATTGLWALPDLEANGSTVLLLATGVAGGTAGRTLGVQAVFQGAAREDTDPANDTASATVDVLGAPVLAQLAVLPGDGSASTVWPESSYRGVLNFAVVNRGALPDTVTAVTVTNLTEGYDAPDQADLDAEWLPLAAAAWIRGNSAPTFDRDVPRTGFVDGRATFGGRRWVIAPGDTLDVSVAASPSLLARDGAVLTAGVADPADVAARQPVTFPYGSPLVSGQALVVDGFVAAQAAVHEVPSRLLGVGSRRNLVFDVTLPSNGYRDDALWGLNLVNRGSAMAGRDIERLEAWLDDGDGLFAAVDDLPLGELVDSGDRWQRTGLKVGVPRGGARLFVTADIAETAQPASDIRLGLPVDFGPGAAMASGNSGPVDAPLENTGSLGISVSDRVILTTDWVPPATAHPGARALPLLSVLLTNTYTQPQTLQALTVTNATVPAGAATPAQLDAVIDQVVLRLDGDGDGVLDDLLTDPPVGADTLVDGVATFTGVDVPLPSLGRVRVFVTGDVGLSTAAEGDVVSLVVAGADDVSLGGAAAVASWPLDSEAAWTIDGLVAEQVALHPVPLQSLGPDEGPALVLDVTLPGNGYRDDELVGIAVADSGSAGPDDFARVRLWYDGGNASFDGGLLDDTEAADLVWTGTVWSSPLLGRPVPVTGQRLFVTVDVAAAPTDSARVRFMVPADGVRMASGNSGPLDAPVVDPGTLILTTSPLRSTLDFQRAASTVGQVGRIVMTVTNTGAETLQGVTPGALQPAGDAVIVLGAPVPASLDVAPSGQATFTWDYTATAPGSVLVTGWAQGTGAASQDVFGSAPSPSSVHTVHTSPVQTDLYPVVNLPDSVNKGQKNLVPLTFTLVNPGDATVADVELTDLRLRLTDTDGGAVLVPEDLIDSIRVAEGTDVYARLDTLPATATDIDLHFDPPARVTTSEPVSLGLRLDLKLSTDVPSFVLAVESADWFAVRDMVNGAPVPLVLAEGSFPLRTGQANLVAPAGSMAVSMAAGSDGVAAPGQTDVPLAGFRVTNEAADASSSPILVTRVAFVLRDDAGAAVVPPLARFTGMALRTAYQDHFAGMPEVLADSVLVIDLTTPAIVAAEATVTLDLTAGLAAGAAPGAVTPVLADVALFAGVDGNNGQAVPVRSAPPASGARLQVVADPGDVAVAATGLLPATVADGAAQVGALALELTHGGDAAAAPVDVEGLVLTVLDGARQPLDPALVLARVRVGDGTNTHGDVVDPSAPDGALAVPLSGLVLPPAGSASLTVRVDLAAGAQGSFELLLQASDVALNNAVTGMPVAVQANGSWPASSGLARVVVPADELVVGGESVMPPLLAPRDDAYPVLSLTFANRATAGGGGIALHALTVTQPAAGVALGRAAAALALTVDGAVVATAQNLDPAARTVTLALDPPLVVPAAAATSARVEIMVAPGAPAGALRLQVGADGVLAGPEGAAPGGVRVVPEGGQAFPLVTEAGNLAAADLAASYANFPNPFAAGREATTFAFSLPRPGRVTLRILTPHGETVATLLRGEARAGGFYQQDRWPGQNGDGHTVRNGVYLAELVVDFDDGTHARVLRKVAVVR